MPPGTTNLWKHIDFIPGTRIHNLALFLSKNTSLKNTNPKLLVVSFSAFCYFSGSPDSLLPFLNCPFHSLLLNTLPFGHPPSLFSFFHIFHFFGCLYLWKSLWWRMERGDREARMRYRGIMERNGTKVPHSPQPGVPQHGLNFSNLHLFLLPLWYIFKEIPNPPQIKAVSSKVLKYKAIHSNR